ncbi:MAG: hypothetical protein HYX68_09300 [Planctomycetes bacterium]|nr:hypothetical protein [Planctomycetota bacterium]
MNRFTLVCIVGLAANTFTNAGEPGSKQTIAYVQKLQTATGGFLPMAPRPNIRVAPNLRSTSAAVRALHYLGGEIPNKKACIKFVESCYDPTTGGFGDMPRGKPDVFLTAVGLMAVTELKMPTEKYAAGAIKFMSENAKSFEDIRIAVAGLERLHATAPKKDQWLKDVLKPQNADGTFGNGPGMARDTGSRVVTILRLGAKVHNPESILKSLKAGQRQNGGYGKADSEIASDLETTYRVMRCFVMLKSRPGHAEGIRSFVAKCRNPDGGYGSAPGQPSNIGGTYFASIILRWLKQQDK